jgi:hypothetical protein
MNKEDFDEYFMNSFSAWLHPKEGEEKVDADFNVESDTYELDHPCSYPIDPNVSWAWSGPVGDKEVFVSQFLDQLTCTGVAKHVISKFMFHFILLSVLISLFMSQSIKSHNQSLFVLTQIRVLFNLSVWMPLACHSCK